MRLFVAAALFAAVPMSALAQPAPPPGADPFAGMTPAGHAKAEALNEKLESDLIEFGKRSAEVRKAFEDAARADAPDMNAVRKAAQAYDERLAMRSDFTTAWVDLAATLEPADRAFILKRLPKVGGVMTAPLQPPLTPKRPGF